MSTQQQFFLRLVLGVVVSEPLRLFSLDDEDVEIITPANRAPHNLIIGVGAVLLNLGSETKCQSSNIVDFPHIRHFCIRNQPILLVPQIYGM
jgi:hypothetical protein